MDTFLVEAHSGLRWIVLLAMVVTVVYAIRGRTAGTWGADALRPARVAAMVFDLQVLLGIITYVVNQDWDENAFIAMIHPAAMIVGLGVFHAAISRARKADSPAGHTILLIGTVVSLAIVLAFIPWNR